MNVHLYDKRGRCKRSVPLLSTAARPDDATAAGVPGGLRKTLLDIGMVLTDWCASEEAGLAKVMVLNDGETEVLIVRIKSDSVQRDMRPAGITMTLDRIRREGVRIDLLDAWQLREDPAEA